MYIYEDAAAQQAEEKAAKIAKLNEFLQLGPSQVNTLYNARLNNMLAEAHHNSLIQEGDPATREKRARLIQVRRRGACKKFELPSSGGETISCVVWDGCHYITGTDIIKIITYRLRLEDITIPHSQQKKFEEGIFSDLRYLKAGRDARLEEARSEFLEWLCRHGAIRTQKKQKVYLWKVVDFGKLLVDARERLARQTNNYTTNTNTNVNAAANVNRHPMPYEEWDSPLDAEWKISGNMLPEDLMLGLAASMENECDVYSTSGSLISELDSISDEVRSTGGSNLSMGDLSGDLLDSGEFGWNWQFVESNMGDTTNEALQIINQYVPPGNLLNATLPVGLFDTPAANEHEQPDNPHYLRSDSFVQSLPILYQRQSQQQQHHQHQQHQQKILPSTSSSSLPHPHHPHGQREEDRRYICSYHFCKRRFKRLEHLKRHLRIHTGERPFICPIGSCRKSFSRSDNLAQHLKIHMASPILPIGKALPMISMIRPSEGLFEHDMDG